MDNDTFLNGYGWVLPVFMAVGLFRFWYSSLRACPPERLRLAWGIVGLTLAMGVLVITLVLELPLSQELDTAREVAFWVLIPALLWARSKHRALVGER